MTALLLARIQFAFTIAFHYIYPPLSIGLGLAMVLIEGVYLKTGNPFYKRMAKFWSQIFALTFAIGVATGIVMEFEFGTNWSTYSRYVGDVFGSALAAEGVFAFFLESGFLALLLFGWDRVGPKLHYFSTIMVSFGSMFSAVWIVVANSWMQTPAGFHIVKNGMTERAEITDFWAMVFNPSSMDRLFHVLMGAWQSGAFLLLSVGAFYLLKKRHEEFAKSTMKFGLFLALIASVLQLVSGHSSAVGVSQNQPIKLAAFEGIYSTQTNAPLHLFGWVDDKTETVHGVALPGMLSVLVHGDTAGEIKGLKTVPPDERPPVNATFQMFHGMVAIGMGLIALSVLGVIFLWAGKLYTTRWLLWVFVFSVLGPQIANQLGWFAAELGRQPWIVQNLLKTSDALSKSVTANMIIASLIMFTLIYALLFVLFLFLLDHKIRRGPDDMVTAEEYRSQGYGA